MVTLFVQNNVQKNERKIRSKSRDIDENDIVQWLGEVNVRHFPPASSRMTPISVCLWRHREHGDSNKRWRQRRFKPSQETGVKKMINGNVPSEFISLWFASVHRAASSIQNFVCLWFYAYKKYKSNSARRTASQRHIQPSICYGGSDNFSSGISGKLPKKSNFKRHFLENGWSYRCKILHDNLEDQVKWHISKLCSFL